MMTWRDRLALWCLRMLTPDGLCGQNVQTLVWFDPGKSTPRDPKLVMRVGFPRVPDDPDPMTAQTVVSLVFDPDTVVDKFADAVASIREWAEG